MSSAFLGATASFLCGVSVALLASYPIPQNNIFVCFIALFLGLVACLLWAWVIVLECTHRERVSAERVIDLTVDRLLKRRGLEVVEGGD